MLQDKHTFKNWVFSAWPFSLLAQLAKFMNAVLQSFQHYGSLSKMLGFLATHIGQGCQRETT